MSYCPTLVLVIAPPIVSASFFMAQYLENDPQQMLRTVLDSKLPPTLASAPVVAQQQESPCKRPLKARFLDIYWGKTYMEYYNFFQ